jgi:hypothetical protein
MLVEVRMAAAAGPGLGIADDATVRLNELVGYITETLNLIEFGGRKLDQFLPVYGF